jgi:hypothetical protein
MTGIRTMELPMELREGSEMRGGGLIPVEGKAKQDM